MQTGPTPLFHAVLRSKLDAAAELIACRAAVDTSHEVGCNSIVHAYVHPAAVIAASHEVIAELCHFSLLFLGRFPDQLYAEGFVYGSSLLGIAAKNNDLPMIRLLVRANAQVTADDRVRAAPAIQVRACAS